MTQGSPSTPSPDEHGSAHRPFSPPLPIAKRVNRNALTIVAVCLFMTVLIAVLTTQRTSSRTTTDEPDPTSTSMRSEPSFLDLPPSKGVSSDTITTAQQPPEDVLGMRSQDAWQWSNEDEQNEQTAWNMIDDDRAYPSAYDRMPPGMSPSRDETYRKALRSPVIPSSNTSAPPAPSVDENQLAQTQMTDDAVLRAIFGDTRHTSAMSSSTPSLQQRPATANALQTTTMRDANTASTMIWTPQAPAHVADLDAGTVIPAVLATAVNSDVPGYLMAYVSRSVYDSRTQRRIIIPQGTKLIGQYDSEITGGQQRLVMVWSQMLLPNGQRVTLPRVESSDEQGASGLPGHVNRHYTRLFGNALMLSVISAGMQLSQPQQSNVYAPPNVGHVAAGAVGQQLGDVAAELIRKNLDIPPTITIPAGTAFNVWLSGDVVVSPR